MGLQDMYKSKTTATFKPKGNCRGVQKESSRRSTQTARNQREKRALEKAGLREVERIATGSTEWSRVQAHSHRPEHSPGFLVQVAACVMFRSMQVLHDLRNDARQGFVQHVLMG